MIMSLYAVALRTPFSGTKGSWQNLFEHGNIPEHKKKSVKTWFAQVGMEKLEWLVQTP